VSQESRDFPLSGFPHGRVVALPSTGGPSIENTAEPYFLRTWLEYDSELERRSRAISNGDRLLGLLLVFAVSGAFWTGVGLLVERLLK
jgi:hypothetical protein